MHPLAYLRSFGLFTSEDGGYDIPQKPLAPYACIGCERLALEIERNLSFGRESCLLCTECGCIMQSKNYNRHVNTFYQKQKDKEMLAKLDNGNAVLFSEISSIEIKSEPIRTCRVSITTKNNSTIFGISYNVIDLIAAQKERDRVINEWEIWLKGVEK